MDESMFNPSPPVVRAPDMATTSGAITADAVRRAAQKVLSAFHQPNEYWMTSQEFQRVYGPLKLIPAQRTGDA